MRWHQEKSHDMHNFSEEVGNTFLARLDEETRLRWQPHLRKMELQRGQALSHAGCSPEYVYFSTRSVVALYAITDDGACSEWALVGHEGLVGLCSAMGSAAIFNNAMVAVGGPSWRMSAAWFRHEVMNDPLIMKSMLRYSQALFTQVAQTAVCTATTASTTRCAAGC